MAKLPSSEEEEEEEAAPPRSPAAEASSSDEEGLSVRRKRKAVLHSSDEDEDEDEGKVEAAEATASRRDPLASAANGGHRSSDEEGSPVPPTRDDTSRIRRPSSSSSSSEEDDETKSPTHPPESAEKKMVSADSDTSDDGVDDPNPKPAGRESDSDDSTVDSAVYDKRGRRRGKEKRGGRGRGARRSKKAAMEEIYSEKNRMLRESAVSLPYHRPKAHTLEEFLNRKKGVPEVISDIKMNINNMKVEEAERILEEREKVAREFFVSDDEEKEEDEDEDDEDFIPENAGSQGSESAADPSTVTVQQAAEETEETEAQASDINEKAATTDSSKEFSANSAPTSDKVGGAKEEGEKSREYGSVTANTNAEEKEADVVELSEDVRMEGVGTTHSSRVANNGEERDGDKMGESESLHLMLENDSEPIVDDISAFTSSQREEAETEEEKASSAPSKGLAALKGKQFDLSSLSKTLDVKPVLGAGLCETDELVLDDEATRKDKQDLMDRLVKHVKAGGQARKAVLKDVNLTIVRKEVDEESGVEQLKAEELNYRSSQANFGEIRGAKVERPGAQRLALKQTLRKKIDERKRAERAKKEEMKKLENEEGFGPEEDIELEEEVEDETEDESEDEASYDGEDEEENEEEAERRLRELDRKRKRRSQFLDDEAEDEDEMGHLALVDDDSDEEKGCSGDEERQKNPPKLQPGGVPSEKATPVLPPSDDGDKNDSIHSPPPAKGDRTPFSQMSDIFPGWSQNGDEEKERGGGGGREADDARKKLGFEGLFDTSDPRVGDTDDVVALCSGQFVTQANKEVALTQSTPDTVVLTQNDVSQNLVETQDTVVLSNNDSNEEDNTPAPGFLEETPGFLLGSDDEDANAKVRKKKAPARLVMSDDSEEEKTEGENETDEDEKNDEEEGEDAGENNAEEMRREVQYDSDENEIIVEKPKFKGFMGKKGIRKEYLENEAELSGDEGDVSGDEDERGLDRLEAEAGDLDDLDEEEVRDQVGRLHQRRELDEDRAEVRLFQEAFLEDGELHTDQARTRRFKWKGIDDTEELERRPSDDDEDLGEASEAEEKRQRVRLEREKWLKESGQEKRGFEMEDVDDEDSQFFNMGNKAVKSLEQKKASSANQRQKQPPKVFRSPTPKLPLKTLSGNQRGSFLARKSEALDRLAELTKGKHEARTGAGANSGSANFVFASVSPGRPDGGKEDAGGDDSRREENSKKSTANKGFKRKKMDLEEENKKARIGRTLDENSMDTIFGFL